ncbi:hypothetical protein [Butyrivibrio sp.]|uniref:hypothetical protein n=1 Tax=Butyrivibrio sp. TaxID=28121 RepID=UPI0025BE7DF1|nr:hypothetical protein [Butyrivibrio sp.]MBQ7431271.1 hypothetical protein [Butyrivibrio sp.]MBQ9303486.1 hypothetical protein [Butyrivibrio sp.]
MSKNKIQISNGDKYGRLTVIRELDPVYRPGGQKVRKIYCICDCGNHTIVDLYELTRKRKTQQSCGCYSRELARKRFAQMDANPEWRKAHPQKFYNRKLKEYSIEEKQYREKIKRLKNIFKCMKHRCYESTDDSYKYYGAKGIGICAEWLNDVFNFIQWALANGYQDNLTIDRRDNTKDYSPKNCHWTTNKYQMNHTSRNNLVYNKQGEQKSVAEWADEYKFPVAALYYRHGKNPDLPIEDLLYPVKPHSTNAYAYNGQIMTMKQIQAITHESMYIISKKYRIS